MIFNRKKIFFLILFLFGCFASFKGMDVSAATNQSTKYKSLKAVEKHYRKTCNKEGATGIYCANKKIKTKCGVKNVLFVYSSGHTPDCTTTRMFFQKGKKVFKMEEITGVPYGVSKNKKYLSVTGGGTFASVYVYKSGQYEKLEEAFNNGQDAYEKAKKGLKKKYKATSSIKYSHKEAIETISSTYYLEGSSLGTKYDKKPMKITYKGDYIYVSGYTKKSESLTDVFEKPLKKIKKKKYKIASTCIHGSGDETWVEENLKKYCKEGKWKEGEILYAPVVRVQISNGKVVYVSQGA